MKSNAVVHTKTKTLLSSVLMLFTAGAVLAQTDWQVSTGSYTLASSWSAGVPTNTTDVVINNGTSGTPSIASLSTNGSGLDFTIGSFDTLNVLPGGQLTVSGSLIQNAGAFNVTGGSGANTILALDSSVTLVGAGALTLGYSGSGSGQAYIEQGTGGVMLTNHSTIQGQGIIGNGGLAVNNSVGGTIDATTGTILVNASGAFTNSGLLEATGGGTLNISGTNIANSSGNITAGTGSTVQLTNMTVTGGTLNNTVTGTLETAGTVGLDGKTDGSLTINGNLFSGPNTQINAVGTIVNDGNLQIVGGNGANAILAITGNTTLQGTGSVTLGYTGSGAGQAYIEQGTGGVTLTNTQEIQGQGVIGNGGLALVNDSIINANTGTILLNASGGVTNSGVLEATSGGTLDINAITVTNTGQNITAGSGSTVDLANATIIGGTLNNNGGTLQVVAAATLDGHSAGPLTINGNLFSGPNTQINVEGTIVNNGNLQLVGGSGANEILGLSGNTTLQGSGTVTMGYTGSGSGQAFIEQGTGGLTLTNEQTIQGQGVIGNGGLALVNDSIINASTGTILLNASGGVTNSGLLEATSGGTLDINAITVTNTGQNITAGSGSMVDLANATIIGGTLNNNGGTLQVVAAATLDGHSAGPLTINGNLFSGPNTQINVEGTIVNNGNLQLVGGSGANEILGLSGNTTLQGSGTVNLGYTGSGSGQAFIEQGTGGLTLTNEQTIQGQGVIGNGGLTLVNSPGGTIDANVNGGTLTVNPSGGFTNTGGLLEATNGGILSLSSSVIDNNGGTIKVDGATSSVSLVNGVTIQGGTLTSVNGGSLGVPGSSITLDGTTQGALTLSTGTTFTAGPNTQTNLLGTIVNNGNMQITGGSGANTILGLKTNTTLQGTGTLTLGYTGSGSGQAFIEQGTGGLTLTNEQTIQGQGVIGNGGLTLVNSPGGTIDANVNGGTLTVNPSGGFTNTGGLLEATNGGLLSLSSSVIDNNGGTIKVDGATSSVSLVNGVTIQGGTLTSVNGGSLGVPGSSIILDGTTQGALTLSTGSTFKAGPNTQTNLEGTIVNNGNMQITGGSGANTIVGLKTNTTLQGTGTVTLGYTGSGTGQAFIEQNTGGLTLTNEQTIQGQGVIGNGGLSVDNAAGGTILANVSGGALNLLNGVALTNEGTIQVNAGSSISDTFTSTTNSGSVAIGGGGASLTVGGTYNQTGGSTVIAAGGTLGAASLNETGGTIRVDGTIDPPGPEHIGFGSTMSGTGSIVGDLTNDGTLILGDDATHPGTLSEIGNYTQGADGVIDESITSLLNGKFDVTGNVSLDGSVDINLLNGFTPTNDEIFTLVDYTGSIGAEDLSVTGSDATDWSVLYETSGQVDLEFNAPVKGVPDGGSTWLLVGAGLASLGFAPRLRRRTKAF